MTKNKRFGFLRHQAWLRRLGLFETVEIGPGPRIRELIPKLLEAIRNNRTDHP